MAVSKNIILGSGKLYMKKMSASDTLDTTTLCTDDNQIGLIKGGAQLSYSAEKADIFDDLKVVQKRFITREEVKFQTGLITFDLQALGTIAGNANYTTASGKNTLKLGGPEGREIEKVALAFVHTKSDNKKITVSMIATNDNGLTLAFNPDEATQIDAEFVAVAGSDSNGTLVIIEEETAAA